MAFQGIDIAALRGLADRLREVDAPDLLRAGNRTHVLIAAYDSEASADRVAGQLGGVSWWLERAADDLRRRAGAVDAAETVHLWGPGLPSPTIKGFHARAAAALTAPMTGDFDDAYAAWVADRATSVSDQLIGDLGGAIDARDSGRIAAIAGRLLEQRGQPWEEQAMAGLFEALGPADAVVMVATMIEAGRDEYDDTNMVIYAGSFAAATRGGLGWTAADITLWFEHGADGAAQYLRSGVIDRDFLRLVVDTIGFGEFEYTQPEPLSGTRWMLGGGISLWPWVGQENADYRVVLLDALSRDLPLAIDVLRSGDTIESLLAADWYIEGGAGLGSLLIQIAGSARPTDTDAADQILRRTILTIGSGEVSVPGELPVALATIASLHIGDLAHALAVGETSLDQISARPGFELPAGYVIGLLRPIVANDAASGVFTTGYANYVDQMIGGVIPESPAVDRDLTEPDEYLAYIRSHADELGSLTFALAYLDRQVREIRAEETHQARISVLHALRILTDAGVEAIPGGGVIVMGVKKLSVDQLFDLAERRIGSPRDAGIADYNDWEEALLDELEYLIALQLNSRGLFDGGGTIDAGRRLEFMHLIEGVDGELETVMTIIEAQARRQEEAIAER